MIADCPLTSAHGHTQYRQQRHNRIRNPNEWVAGQVKGSKVWCMILAGRGAGAWFRRVAAAAVAGAVDADGAAWARPATAPSRGPQAQLGRRTYPRLHRTSPRAGAGEMWTVSTTSASPGTSASHSTVAPAGPTVAVAPWQTHQHQEERHAALPLLPSSAGLHRLWQ